MIKTKWYVFKTGNQWQLWFEDDTVNAVLGLPTSTRRLMSEHSTRTRAISAALAMSDVGDEIIG